MEIRKVKGNGAGHRMNKVWVRKNGIKGENGNRERRKNI